jgi:hypothetical protein
MEMIAILSVIAVGGYFIYTKKMCCNKRSDDASCSAPQATEMMTALSSMPAAKVVEMPAIKKPAAKKPAAAKAPAKKVTKAPAVKKPAAKAKAPSATKAKK